MAAKLEIYKLQNASEWSGEEPNIVITKDTPQWDDAYKKWLNGQDPTDSKLWKQAVIACYKPVDKESS